MSLTLEQLQTLKASIAADPAFAAVLHNSDGAFAVAAAYNLAAALDYFVWRSNVAMDEVMLNGFDWARVDNLSVGKARIWEWMGQLGSFDPSKTNVRAGIIAVWVGTAPDLAVRLAVFQHCQRLATRAEKLFATGTGTTALVDGTGPSTMAFDGDLTYQDVMLAWNS